jgi:flavodoxin
MVKNIIKRRKVMSKKLVAYFSASGTTANVAKNLANAAGADLYEIKPAVPYTKDDLNWMDKQSRSSVEMRDKSSRPALADTDAKIADYDTVFIGFPIWWYIAPTIINSFLEAYDFSGKKIVLFATSGGSGFGKAVASLQPSAPKATITEGEILNGRPSEAKLKAFADKF